MRDWGRFVQGSEARADEASEALRAGTLAFFAGAGVSMGPPALLPGWHHLVTEILRAVAGDHPEAVEEFRYVTDERNGYFKFLFNEMVLYLLKSVVSLPEAARALEACLDTSRYCLPHRVLAWAMDTYGASVLTSNFDELIERAREIEDDRVVKLHGTLRRLDDARFTADNVFARLASALRRRTKELVAGRTLVILGYGGEDEFDILPALFEGSLAPSRILWAMHCHESDKTLPVLSDSARRRLRKFGDRAIAFPAHTDSFLHRLYETTRRADPARCDPMLDAWELPHEPNKPGWWRARVESWGRDLHSRQGESTRFLWARILDQLRIYKVTGPSGTRNYTESAFRRFLDVEPASRGRALEARARLAAMSRMTGTADPQGFSEILAQLDDTLDDCRPEEKEELRGLRGWTLHQSAVALQSQALSSGSAEGAREALRRIQEAIAHRREARDPQVAYSLFQKFIMSYYIRERWPTEVMAAEPDVTPEDLCLDLDRWARRFLRKRAPEHCGTTRHNLGFVYQTLALERERSVDLDDARRLFAIAIRHYNRGKLIRIRLRDPRMIAQSDVRIAQCELGLARAMRARSQPTAVLGLTRDAERLSHEVDDLYRRTPQEEHRKRDLKAIWAEAEGLYRWVISQSPADSPGRGRRRARSDCLARIGCLMGLLRIAEARAVPESEADLLDELEGESERLESLEQAGGRAASHSHELELARQLFRIWKARRPGR